MKTARRRAISLAGLSVEKVEAVPLAPGFSIAVNGLVVHGRPTFKQWESVGALLRVAHVSVQFAFGDFLNGAEAQLGERASQIIDYSSGWSEKTCAAYRWLASRIALADRRMDRLTIRHHLAVAALAPASQRKWLEKAAADDEEQPWTVKRMVDAMREGEDLPPAAWWILVQCQSAIDQTALLAAMEAQGRTCKAVVRRARVKAGDGSRHCRV